MDSSAVTPSATLHAFLSRRNPFGRLRNLNWFFSGAHCLFRETCWQGLWSRRYEFETCIGQIGGYIPKGHWLSDRYPDGSYSIRRKDYDGLTELVGVSRIPRSRTL